MEINVAQSVLCTYHSINSFPLSSLTLDIYTSILNYSSPNLENRTIFCKFYIYTICIKLNACACVCVRERLQKRNFHPSPSSNWIYIQFSWFSCNTWYVLCVLEKNARETELLDTCLLLPTMSLCVSLLCTLNKFFFFCCFCLMEKNIFFLFVCRFLS